MKSEKGITLLSIVVYMVALTITLAGLASLSNFFFSNKDYLLENAQYISEYNKFNMYFIEDVKKNTTARVKENEIIFGDGNVYTFKQADDKGNSDNGIYRNKVKICTKVSNCRFQLVPDTNDKIVVKVTMQIESFKTSNNYVLKYW